MKLIVKRVLLALCVVLIVATAGWCINPFKVNKGGFGPKIKGLQLGMKLEGPDIDKAIADKSGLVDGIKRGAWMIVVNGEKRIMAMNFFKGHFGAHNMTTREFVQEFAKSYGIPMKAEIDGWRYRNLAKGWEVSCTDAGVITVTAVSTEPKFN